MGRDEGRRYPRRLWVLGILLPALLAVQFSSGVVLAAMDLPTATLSLLGQVFESYGAALVLVLIASIALIVLAPEAPIPRPIGLILILMQGVGGVWWLTSTSDSAPLVVKASFPIFAAAVVAVTAAMCLFAMRRRTRGGWTRWAHLSLVGLVPLVFALRIAANLGLGTSPGPSGALQGNWLLVNAPTILLEYVAIGMWLLLMWDPGSHTVRRRWDVWLPLVLLLPAGLGLILSSLFSFVFSALITWGTNLAVFVPVTVSLSLAAAAIACYVSFFLLLRRLGSDRWKPLLLGTAAVLLSGFYPSIISLAGLSYGLLATTAALAPEHKDRLT